METFEKRYQVIQSHMDEAQNHWGHPIKLIAVTKTHPIETINKLAAYQLFEIGENRVQEIMSKIPLLDPHFRIHLIGQLQTNKVKYIIDNVCQIQSVDRMSLAEEINRRAMMAQRCMDILVQVSPCDEAQKGGIPIHQTEDFIRNLANLPGLRVKGLMAIMPNTNDEKVLNDLFGKMRNLFERLAEQAISNVDMKELSMGMSNDYRLALQNGANVIRVGSALFGTRR